MLKRVHYPINSCGLALCCLVLLLTLPTSANAMVTGQCANCHTMQENDGDVVAQHAK